MIPTTHCEFRITRNHTHADVDYAAGAEIDLPLDVAEKLQRLGVGTITTEKPKRLKPKRK